jgi:hypothetical protein
MGNRQWAFSFNRTFLTENRRFDPLNRISYENGWFRSIFVLLKRKAESAKQKAKIRILKKPTEPDPNEKTKRIEPLKPESES